MEIINEFTTKEVDKAELTKLCRARIKDDSYNKPLWAIGYYIKTSDDRTYCYIIGKNKYDSINSFEIYPDTVCRCIGLLDADSNLIFEKDIIKKEYYVDYDAYTYSGEYIGEVAYDDFGCWIIRTNNNAAIPIYQEMEFTEFKRHNRVIGNTFETPELLSMDKYLDFHGVETFINNSESFKSSEEIKGVVVDKYYWGISKGEVIYIKPADKLQTGLFGVYDKNKSFVAYTSDKEMLIRSVQLFIRKN